MASLGLLFYSYNIRKIGLFNNGSVSICMSIDNSFSKILAIFDIVCTMILPFFTITIINGLIGVKLINVNKNGIIERTQISEITENNKNAFKSKFSTKTPQKNSIKSNQSCSEAKDLNKKQLKREKSTNYNPIANYNSAKDSVKFPSTHSAHRSQSEKATFQVLTRKKIYSRTNKILFSISISFLVLHAPIALIKFKHFRKFQESNKESLSNLMNENKSLTSDGNISIPNLSKEFNSTEIDFLNVTSFYFKFNPLEHIFERITTNIYYLNFVFNFFLYSLNGSKFRESVLKIFKKNPNSNTDIARNIAHDHSFRYRNKVSKSQV